MTAGQTLDIGTGTPLAVHAVIGDAATNVEGAAASATASALHLDLLADPLPTISLVASEVSCGVTGEAARVVPPPKTAPLPKTGAPLTLIYAFGGLMLAAGIGMVRFLRKASA